MPPPRHAVLALPALLLLASQAVAQSPYVIRAPHWDWRTMELPHWRVHYPAQAKEFARCVTARLEPMYRSVSALVGYDMPGKTTLVITDALGFDGAYASANTRAPVIVLQTQPSVPRSGGYSDCATARVTHELTHILQLSRPWTREHPLWIRAGFRLLPAAPGPIIFRRKPWLREAYAEHVEGILTPTGSPYTTQRANAIRRLAASGRFPAYRELDHTYEGRYLVGSAFVDELATLAGDSAFPRLWERMASPHWEGDDIELARLFGGPPDSLYARFSRRALARSDTVAARVRDAGTLSGREVRDVGYADYVAVSPDGATLAAVFGRPLLQLTLAPARDGGALERFPLVTGQSPNSPRFTPDGTRVLFVSWELVSHGVWRPDVYEWELATRRLRRVTHRSAIREVDPMPDGRSAVGTRCEFGICDLVRLHLNDGSYATIARGSPSLMFARPRVSRAGEVVVAVQSGARSRIALVSPSGALRYVDPDDGASRYEPAFLRDGRIVVVSEATGIPALELLDPRTGTTRALTRTVHPAYAPEPDPASDSVYFVAATAAGSVVRLVALADTTDVAPVLRDSSLFPAAPVPFPDATPPLFPAELTPASRSYGLGPRFISVVPSGSWSVDGASGGVDVWTSDIVGRLSVMGTVYAGQARAMRGLGIAGILRAARLPLIVNVALAEQSLHASAIAANTELSYRGVSARTEWTGGPWARRLYGGVGAALGDAQLSAGGSSQSVGRAFATGSYAMELTQVAAWYLSEMLTVGAAGGTTNDVTWARWTSSARLEVGRVDRGPMLTMSASAGLTTAGAPAFEQFSVGGLRPALVGDVALAQRIAQPLLRTGMMAGSRMATLRLAGPPVRRLRPFLWTAAAGDSLTNWQSLAGVSGSLTDDPRRNWRVPGVQLGTSVGYAFGDVKGVRAHVALTYTQ